MSQLGLEAAIGDAADRLNSLSLNSFSLQTASRCLRCERPGTYRLVDDQGRFSAWMCDRCESRHRRSPRALWSRVSARVPFRRTSTAGTLARNGHSRHSHHPA
jgi:hypothetical protein